MVSAAFNPVYGLLAISNDSVRCQSSDKLQTISGYQAFPLPGATGVGLIPVLPDMFGIMG